MSQLVASATFLRVFPNRQLRRSSSRPLRIGRLSPADFHVHRWISSAPTPLKGSLPQIAGKRDLEAQGRILFPLESIIDDQHTTFTAGVRFVPDTFELLLIALDFTYAIMDHPTIRTAKVDGIGPLAWAQPQFACLRE